MNKKIFRPFAGLLLLSAACLGQTPTTNITAAAPIVVSAPTGYIQISCPGCAGTAGPVVLANGTTATTQTTGDNTTKLATDAFVLANGSSYTLPTATSSVLGGVKPDGTTISNTGGAIAVASPYNPASVAITGGTINGTVIGGVTPAAVNATSYTGTGSDPFINLPSNPSHSCVVGDVYNNAGVLTFCSSSGPFSTPGEVNITPQISWAGCTQSGYTCTVVTPPSTIVASAIPQGFTSLEVICTYNGNGASPAGLYLQFNGDTSADYISQLIYGIGSTAAGLGSGLVSQATFLTFPGSSSGTMWASADITIPNYSIVGSKSAIAPTTRWATSSSIVLQNASLMWTGTAAITSFTIGALSPSLIVAGSTCSVYGKR